MAGADALEPFSWTFENYQNQNLTKVQETQFPAGVREEQSPSPLIPLPFIVPQSPNRLFQHPLQKRLGAARLAGAAGFERQAQHLPTATAHAG